MGIYRLQRARPVRNLLRRSDRIDPQDGAFKWDSILWVGIGGLLILGAWAGYRQATENPQVVRVPVPVPQATTTLTPSPAPTVTYTPAPEVRTIIIPSQNRTVIVKVQPSPYPSPYPSPSPCDRMPPVIGNCPP